MIIQKAFQGGSPFVEMKSVRHIDDPAPAFFSREPPHESAYRFMTENGIVFFFLNEFFQLPIGAEITEVIGTPLKIHSIHAERELISELGEKISRFGASAFHGKALLL